MILAGVYDIKSLQVKLRPNEEHKTNSPWNTREGNESNEGMHSFDDCPYLIFELLLIVHFNLPQGRERLFEKADKMLLMASDKTGIVSIVFLRIITHPFFSDRIIMYRQQ